MVDVCILMVSSLDVGARKTRASFSLCVYIYIYIHTKHTQDCTNFYNDLTIDTVTMIQQNLIILLLRTVFLMTQMYFEMHTLLNIFLRYNTQKNKEFQFEDIYIGQSRIIGNGQMDIVPSLDLYR